MRMASISEIVDDLKQGRMVIIVDDEDRENEGDIIVAADFATPDVINFMTKYARGLVCLTLTQERCIQLGLSQMTSKNNSAYHTAFTTSIEAAKGVTTGISAFDRAKTIACAIAKNATPEDIVQPGHIFPIVAKEGGVLTRAGHTEAGCDLTRLAGLTSAAVLCEIMNDDGTMARLPDLKVFAKKHNLKIGTIADLIAYRSQNESLVKKISERPITTIYGSFTGVLFQDTPTQSFHLALVKGQILPNEEVLARVHPSPSLLDFLESNNKTHAWSINDALKRLSLEKTSVLVLLSCGETTEQFLSNFTRDENAKNPATSSHVLRDYGIGAQILKHLGVSRLRLLANPRKMPSMAGFGLDITQYVSNKE